MKIWMDGFFPVALAGSLFSFWKKPTPFADLDRLPMDDSGIRYEILTPGDGPQPRHGDRVQVHYTGWLTDGKKFDSSRDRKAPFTFWLGRGEVIRGWDESVARMHVGEKRRVVIPSELGYGDRRVGPIPAGSPLVFEIELLGIEDLG